MNHDQDGYIVTTTGDNGDTCAEEGRFWFLIWFNFVVMSNYGVHTMIESRDKRQLLDGLEITPGVYVRHPSRPSNTTSRDQLIPIIYYCGAYKDYSRLKRLFLATLKRGFFAQNDYKDGQYKLPDQMITIIGAFIRCGGNSTAILYPVLYIFDLLDIMGTILWLLFPLTWNSEYVIWYKPSTWFTKRTPDDVDDNNLDIGLLAGVYLKPTFICTLHRVLWGIFRPRNLGNTKLGEVNPCLGAICWYHAHQNQGNEDVSELYRKPLTAYMKTLRDYKVGI